MQKESIKFMGLQFDNHISVGHILTTLSILVAGLVWSVNTENRISQLEKTDMQFEKLIEKQKAEQDANMTYIRNKLDVIVDKLEKKVDRR